MKTLLLLTLLSLVPHFAHAEDDGDDEAIPADAIMLDRAVGQTASTGPLRLRVHKAGHLNGKPYVIEISETCASGEQVIDTHSVCDVALNTVGIRADRGEISLVVRDPSSNASGCELRAKRVVFRLQSHCE